jgi:hypothetical protein
MAARFDNVLWRLGLLLGGSIWIAVLALAYSAGPIEEAVFWASLIAALPVGFGWICHYILSSKNGAADSTVVAPAGPRPRTEPAIAQAHKDSSNSAGVPFCALRGVRQGVIRVGLSSLLVSPFFYFATFFDLANVKGPRGLGAAMPPSRRRVRR